MAWPTRVLALFLVAAATTTARAGTLETTKVAGWSVGAYSDDRTGTFSHCATSVPYRSGILLLFYLSKSLRWSMGLANQRWRLARGESFDVTYYVDDGPRQSVRARATRATLVSIPLADSVALFRRFQRGRLLHVVTAQDRYAFKLTNSSLALKAILLCVKRHLPPKTVTNPFVRRSPGSDVRSPQSGGNDSDRRAEATAVAANVLAASGIRGFRILPQARLPGEARRFGAVWEADGGLLGTVSIVTPRKATTRLEDVVAALLALDAKGCKGAFKSGRYPTEGSSGAGRLMTLCSDARYPEMQYTVVPRPDGGFYVLAVTGNGLDSQAVLDAGAKLHDVAQKTLVAK